jgi:hypothetical protein
VTPAAVSPAIVGYPSGGFGLLLLILVVLLLTNRI